ncbi:MAG: amidohydrolase [Bacteroidota bacterium]|nr:amidohydrolase [Bacteroidota bacterium]MDW8138241.1 amidohydrolase [Bacteroidota bacterium]
MCAVAPQLPWADWLVRLRRHLHRNPEVGFEERETAVFIEEQLRALGLSPRRVAGTGVVVELFGRGPGPLRAYRSDIDALPVADAKTAPYASSRAGVAHLCGHDAHVAIALGVVRYLLERSDWSGSIRVFFQPAEEPTPSGALQMVQAGVMEGVEAIYAVHVDPTLPVGAFGFRVGALSAATDVVRLLVRGPRTVHASRPHEAPDPVWVAVQIAQACYGLAGRVHDARQPAVWALTYLRAGTALNVIPDVVELAGTLRTTDPEDRERWHRALAQIAHALAKASGVECLLEIQRGSPPVCNDKRLVEHARRLARALFGPEAVREIERPSMWGEDFSRYLEHAPGAMIRVGTCGSPQSCFELHDSRFDVDERALPLAVVLMGEVLRQWPPEGWSSCDS